MRHFGLLAALLSLAGCAPSQSSIAPSGATRPVRLQTEDLMTTTTYEFNITPTDRVVSNSLAGAPERAWPYLVAAYQEIGLPINILDEKTWTLGTLNASTGRKLMGQPLSTFLDCGRAGGGALRVQTYAVNVAVHTVLKRAGQESFVVHSVVQGRAKDPVQNNPPVTCSSTGKLEENIANRIRANLGS